MRHLWTILVLLTSSLSAVDTFSERVDFALKEYFPSAQAGNATVTEITIGLSSAKNYRIETEGQKYFLRLQDLTFPKNYLEHWLPTACQAGNAGIAPKIYWMAPDSSAVLMEHLDGKTLTVDQAKRPENIVKVAQALRKIHALPLNPSDMWPFFDELEYMFGKLQEWKWTNREFEQAMADARKANLELAKRNYPHATVHNDLNARNIFLTKDGVRFVDWTETGIDDPYFDLAYYSISLNYTHTEDMVLLDSYCNGHSTQDERNHFALAKKISLMCFAILLPYYSHDWAKEEGIELDLTKPIIEWSWYLNYYSDSRNDITPQFFYDSGKSALQRIVEKL